MSLNDTEVQFLVNDLGVPQGNTVLY